MVAIAVCRRRTDKVLCNTEMSWGEFCDRASKPRRSTETMDEYLRLSKAEQSEMKDVGGFVGGHLQDGRRTKNTVKYRSMLTLDLDDAAPDTWERIKAKFNFCCCVYSTRKHTPSKPRLRLIILLSRDVLPEEYEAIARKLAELIGMEVFDPSTFQPERMMFWPSTCADGEFLFDRIDGLALEPMEYLAMYDDWKDETTWPRHPQESQRFQKSKTVRAGPISIAQEKEIQDALSGQADPLTKPGIIGAFCRAYFPIGKAIERFLSDVYAPSAVAGRYDYIPADSAAGVVLYDNRFIYSHHAHDPVCGILLNAFDMLRLHMFGGLDDEYPPGTPTEKLPSFKKMVKLARDDDKVKALLEDEQQKQVIDCFDVIDDAEEDDDIGSSGSGGGSSSGSGGGSSSGSGGGSSSGSGGGSSSGSGGGSSSGSNGGGNNSGNSWMNQLECDKNGNIKATLSNLLRILKHDPKLNVIVYNNLWGGLEIKGGLPWKHPSPFWREADDAQLVSYVSSKYAPFSVNQCNIALTKCADDRSYHPIEEYFENLPDWDGTKRVDTLLIDYLGAEDNDFVRAVTRKTLCAAVSRIQDPGCKFDYVLTLVGPQGIGKSTLIAKLAGNWFSDDLSFYDMRDKTAAEKLRGMWIVEIGELAGMRNTEVELVRSFISRQDDYYRPAFGRRAIPHPRQCIFIGTANHTNGFLQDTTGNRRFWPVATPGNGSKHPKDLTEADIQQVWAETLVYANRDEKLYLDQALESKAEEAQRNAMEHDEREGLVQMYLEKPLPDDWDNMNIYSRINYLDLPTGVKKRTQVCNLEIWCECFGRQKEDIKASDSRGIAAILACLGWKRVEKKVRVPIYGPQYIYTH